LEQRLKEQEDELKKHDCPDGEHYDKEQDKCVPNKPPEPPEPTEETKKLQETVEALTTKVENLEARQKGKFKGETPKVKGEEGEGFVDKAAIEKEARETAREKK